MQAQHKARNATNVFLLVFNLRRGSPCPQKKIGPPEIVILLLQPHLNCLGIRGPVAGL